MKRRRGPWLLAILTALLGAPSVALAEAPNTLAAPAVTPVAGSTSTSFVFSVVYHSSAGNPAGSVSASVAGRTLSMSLAAGTTVSGTWTTTSYLPAGSWPVTYHAYPSRGPQPRVDGPTVTVIPAVPATAAPTPVAPPGTPDASGTADAGSGSGTSPPPSGEPAIVASAAPSSPASAAPLPGATATAGPATPPPAAPAGGISSTAGAPPTRIAPSVGPGAPHPSTSTVAVPGASSSAAASGELGIGSPGGSPLGGTSLPVWHLMIGGLIAVAMIALLGTAWLALPWRRRATQAVGEDAATGSPPSPEEATRALLDRRSRRRARIRETDDPVLASMGLDEPGDGLPGATQRDVARARRRAARRDDL